MTECFIHHEPYAIRLHVGPSFEDHARVDFRQSIQQILSDSNCVHQHISNIGKGRLVISIAWHPCSISAQHLMISPSHYLLQFWHHYLHNMKWSTKISEIFLCSIITHTAWLIPSKLLANVLEAKLPKNSLWPTWLVSVPLLQEVSSSLIAIVLALLPSA